MNYIHVAFGCCPPPTHPTTHRGHLGLFVDLFDLFARELGEKVSQLDAVLETRFNVLNRGHPTALELHTTRDPALSSTREQHFGG